MICKVKVIIDLTVEGDDLNDVEETALNTIENHDFDMTDVEVETITKIADEEVGDKPEEDKPE